MGTARRVAIPLLIALGLALRLVWPLADPPDRLSWSTGIYTDPASKTLPARYAVELGDWHRAEGPYLRAFPLANGLTWVFYRIFGVGRLSQHLLAAVVSAAGLAGLAAALRRGPGAESARIAVLLAACSYWLVMFSRVPVVENLVATLLVLSCAFALSPSAPSRSVAGALAVAAVLFGKYHAVGFVPVPLLFALLRDRKPRVLLPMLAGGAAVLVLWLVTTYLPHRAEIVAYVRRVSTGIHGALPVTRSPVEGALGIFRSVRAAWVFQQAPVMGSVGLLFALWTVVHPEALRRRLANGSAIFALWVIALWLYYSFLSYKAPRYYVVIGLPLAACAACQVTEWAAAARVRLPRPRGWRSWLSVTAVTCCLCLVAVDVLRQLLSIFLQWERTRTPEAATAVFRALSALARRIDTSSQEMLWAAVLAAIVVTAWALGRRALPSASGKRLAMTVVAAALLIDAVQLTHWATHRKYVIEDVKRVVPSLIARDSVVLGPFAAMLTQDSGIEAVSLLDPLGHRDVLAEYGVTHVVVDERSEETGFALRVPGLKERSTHLQGWAFRSRWVKTLRLSRIDTAPSEPTLFERAVGAMGRGQWEEALERFADHRAAGGAELAEVCVKEATCWISLNDPARARERLLAALRVRPDDPSAIQNLGLLAYRSGDADTARRYWTSALRLEPHNTDLIGLIRRAARDQP